MGFERGVPALLNALFLAAGGLVAGLAWRYGMWGLALGAALAVLWFALLNWAMLARPHEAVRRNEVEDAPVTEAAEAPRLLLDAAPTPMLAIEGDAVRALNRAARRLFATDDRVLPAPPELADRHAERLRHAGHGWRIDRVAIDPDRMVVALVDVEQEERTAEARATAELIQVLGHELLNGLAPIASLAESGLAAVDRPAVDAALLREILGTLARRAEGLQRFAEAYRALARLPDPVARPVPVAEVAADLARLFAGRWPGVTLRLEAVAGTIWPMDRDQITQATWALLQNAAEAVRDGRGEVTLRARVADDGLLIEVADDGPGIAPDAAARIFHPFHTTKPGGTGIGLSLARQIARAHGGTLTLVQGGETLFRLSLPGSPAAAD